MAVQATVRGTLGPYGGDVLLVDANGRQTITNDGATVMKVREEESCCAPPVLPFFFLGQGRFAFPGWREMLDIYSILPLLFFALLFFYFAFHIPPPLP
jgi:hypothetical protein